MDTEKCIQNSVEETTWKTERETRG